MFTGHTDALLKTLSKNSPSKFERDFTKICNNSPSTFFCLWCFDEPPEEIRRKSEIINSIPRKFVSFFEIYFCLKATFWTLDCSLENLLEVFRSTGGKILLKIF